MPWPDYRPVHREYHFQRLPGHRNPLYAWRLCTAPALPDAPGTQTHYVRAVHGRHLSCPVWGGLPASLVCHLPLDLLDAFLVIHRTGWLPDRMREPIRSTAELFLLSTGWIYHRSHY